jgi:hypothetical protein
MTMRTDVPVDLGAGMLPLPVAAVRAAFAELDLPWTTAAALRALAHDESTPPPAPRAVLETHRPRRMPPLRPVPVTQQLSLF